MKVIRGLPGQLDSGRVVTLGVFDGVHRGHEKLLRQLKNHAKRLKVPAAIITFHDHPHTTLAPKQRPLRLALLEQCLKRMQVVGVDEVYVVNFSARMANTPAEIFVERFLHQRLHVRQVVIGADFVFGKGGAGSLALLRSLGKRFGFGVSVVNPSRCQGRIISSSQLRSLVASGQIRAANRRLGWNYAIHGRVVHGDGRGRRIGIPTANLHSQHEIIPASGTYAVAVRLSGQDWLAMCHIGNRPTFKPQGKPTIEVHIPGWRGNLYSRCLEVRFLAELRPERTFRNSAALLQQIEKDWKAAKRIWTKIQARNTMVPG